MSQSTKPVQINCFQPRQAPPYSDRLLAGYLQNLNPGPVEETTHLERLLARVWDDLDGNEVGMSGHKLMGSMEAVQWNPPLLTFTVERHGGTVLGSTRAELQQWTIDLDRMTATCERKRHRQLHPMAKRIDVSSIADDVAQSILDGVTDDRLRWLGDGRVQIQVSKIYPGGSGFKQTVQGRRRRFRKALIEKLSPSGWAHLGRNTYGKTSLPTASR